jgi:hypothetical protein
MQSSLLCRAFIVKILLLAAFDAEHKIALLSTKGCDDGKEPAQPYQKTPKITRSYRGSSTNARPHPTPDSVCNTITSTTRNATNINLIEAALAAIESLKPREKLLYA